MLHDINVFLFDVVAFIFLAALLVGAAAGLFHVPGIAMSVWASAKTMFHEGLDDLAWVKRRFSKTEDQA